MPSPPSATVDPAHRKVLLRSQSCSIGAVFLILLAASLRIFEKIAKIAIVVPSTYALVKQRLPRKVWSGINFAVGSDVRVAQDIYRFDIRITLLKVLNKTR